MQRDRASAVCYAYIRKVHSKVVHTLFLDVTSFSSACDIDTQNLHII